MSHLNQRKDQFMSQIDDLFGFNLTNRQDTVSYDFGQYKLNKLYKPLVKYFIDQFHKHLEEYDTIQSEKILGLFLDFYSLYYSNGDFGYFKNRFSTYQYRIPYSGKDTEFWRATKDCYYVKTSDVVNDMAVSLGGMFDGRDAQLKFFKKTQADTTESGEETFSFGVEVNELTDEESGEVIGYNITFINREESKEKRTDKEKMIYEKLQEYGIDTKSEPIKSTLDNFLKKWGRDYFIHKRLKAFLTEELERYFFQMLKTDIQGKSDILAIQAKIEEIKAKYSDDPEVVDFKIGQLMKESKPDVQPSVYETAYLWILNFANILGDLEEFKAKLWNKKRKVIKQEYCISLSKITNYKTITNDEGGITSDFVKEVLANEKQQAEWRELGMTNQEITNEEGQITNEGLRMTNDESLVIDTKNYTGAIREKLLEIGANEEIMGELYHSDNYQALRFMQDEYRDKVKCIYIDPPYNTGNDGFVYKDSYQSASWLSMMQDRLLEAKQLMSEDGVIFTSMDDSEITNLRKLNDNIYGKSFFIAGIMRKRKKEKSNDTKGFAIQGEYLLVYSKTDKFIVLKEKLSQDYLKSSYKKNKDGKMRRAVPLTIDSGHQGGGYKYGIKTPSGKIVEKTWRLPESSFNKLIEQNLIYFGANGDSIPQKIKFLDENSGTYPSNYWYDTETNKDGKKIMLKIFGSDLFETVKPIGLISKSMEISMNSDGLVLDFFAGSGTTGHAVMKLNKEDGGKRKFILVELGQYFDTVTLPRIKKVMYSDNRKDGQATDNDGNHGIVSYRQLNQYEDRFNEGGYLSRIDSQIRQLEQTDVSKIHDVKNILYPLRELKERIYELDEQSIKN